MARAGNKKRDSILMAGEQLFNQYGLSKTTMEDIAREAHVAKGTLYKYFPSKEEVFTSVVEHEGNMLISMMMEAVQNEVTPIGKIRALITVKTQKMKKLANFYRVTREDAHRLWPYLENTRFDFFQQEVTILEDIIREGIRERLFRVNDAKRAARAIVAALKGLEIEWISRKDADQQLIDIEMILDIIGRGIMVPQRDPAAEI
ncbi:MAG TPA: TetR family transcriptional regulator [candidate division Zixibacteria bacterium]|nr:TetR family transcriptional regulator [candidate division Zixibacteria bacterium]